LYKAIHSLHHRNTNPGPWSGLSIHPGEHVLYFSAVVLHWVVPGHSGFERIEVGEGSVATGGYAHYLHHKYFEVNYADGAIPLDKWFGSFHDGSPEADAAMRRRRLARRTAEPVDTPT
jgi:sterol desaturase/sphingolipid hydroxylase (fatty acid hydroxylase superfamily)